MQINQGDYSVPIPNCGLIEQVLFIEDRGERNERVYPLNPISPAQWLDILDQGQEQGTMVMGVSQYFTWIELTRQLKFYPASRGKAELRVIPSGRK